MRSSRFTSKIVRGAAVGIGVASIALLGFQAPASASVEVLPPTFDTYTGWGGAEFVQPWGHPNTTTYGQTITVPAGKKKVRQFSFYMAGNTGTGDITYRGAVYGWDGSKATNKVYETKAKTISVTQGDPTIQEAKIKVPKRKGKVTAGNQYVLFLSVSKDYETTDPGVLSQWAAYFSDALPGGDVVFLNDGGDESQWTTQPWSVFTGFDFAFKATLT